MNKLRITFLSISLLLFSIQTGAQTPPIIPDTPTNHWIYQAISSIRSANGLFVGLHAEKNPFVSRSTIGDKVCDLWILTRIEETNRNELLTKIRSEQLSSSILTFQPSKADTEKLVTALFKISEIDGSYEDFMTLYRGFEPEILAAAQKRTDCKNFSLELRVRYLELTSVRYDWDTNLNIVDPADLKPEKCGREDRGKFNGLLTAAGKPVTDLKKDWAGDLKLTSRLEFALATYLLHKELRGKYTKPSLQAMTTLTTEFRRELVYYFGFDMYELKSESK